ncbi:MAG: phosphoribosylamine--glycine ligase [Litorilinea sp.]
MRVLLVGGGGREHALAWRLTASPRLEKLWVAPGNGGTAHLPKTENVAIPANDAQALCDFAQAQAIDLTLVGPEEPLAAGLVDRLQALGLRVFGPTQAAAELESSKAFAKEFMERHNIPTGRAGIFDEFDDAVRFLRAAEGVPVIKASGLAAGKGVILPGNKADAALVLRSILMDGKFGAAGNTVLIEERLEGPEISVLAFCDGTRAVLMPVAQDHKRLMDGDIGPNTGGMGAFAPSPLATPALLDEVQRTIIGPTLAGMAAEGRPYHGVLYAGLMITPDGPRVLEFNCRFGDPETQVILPLLDSDLLDICEACIDGTLDELTIGWHNQAALTVVVASGGYPGDYTVGVAISQIEVAEARGCLVFHAGTKLKEGRLLTDGGRVLAVTGLGESLGAAATQAYRGITAIQFNDLFYRKDIGKAYYR